jgi:hypothetical protein
MKTLLVMITLVLSVTATELTIHKTNDFSTTVQEYENNVLFVTFIHEDGNKNSVACLKIWQRGNNLYLFAPWFNNTKSKENILWFKIQQKKAVFNDN